MNQGATWVNTHINIFSQSSGHRQKGTSIIRFLVILSVNWLSTLISFKNLDWGQYHTHISIIVSQTTTITGWLDWNIYRYSHLRNGLSSLQAMVAEDSYCEFEFKICKWNILLFLLKSQIVSHCWAWRFNSNVWLVPTHNKQNYLGG